MKGNLPKIACRHGNGMDLAKQGWNPRFAPYLYPPELRLLNEEGWKRELEQQHLSSQGRSGSLRSRPRATGSFQGQGVTGRWEAFPAA